jgi:hypothetical protein
MGIKPLPNTQGSFYFHWNIKSILLDYYYFMDTNQPENIWAKLTLTPLHSWCRDLSVAFHIHRLSPLNTKCCTNNKLPWKQTGSNAVCSVLIFLVETPKT